MTAERKALLLGVTAVTLFSISLPATRLAVIDIDPFLVGAGRATIGGALAIVGLRIIGVGMPPRAALSGVFLVAFGGVVCFPILTSLALQDLPSVHGSVAVGLLPLVTAAAGTLRAHERPGPLFWLVSVAGVLGVVAFAWSEGGGALRPADLWLLVAVVTCGLSYAEGALLARDFGGLAVISWALIVSLPIMVPLAAWRVAVTPLDVSRGSWSAFAYLCLMSAYLSWVPWFRALAGGGIARIGQVQLMQPPLSVLLAVLFLAEEVTLASALALAAVVACAAIGRRVREPGRPRAAAEATVA